MLDDEGMLDEVEDESMSYFQSLDESCWVIKGGNFQKKQHKFAGLTSA